MIHDGSLVTRARPIGLAALALLLSALSGCGQVDPLADMAHDAEVMWHVTALQNDDLSYDVLSDLTGTWDAGMPDQIWGLVELAPRSTPYLLELLSDETLTSQLYLNRLTFQLGLYIGRGVQATATIGDWADYALRYIYYPEDGGFRSYDSPAERELAIQRWRQIVSDNPTKAVGNLPLDGIPQRTMPYQLDEVLPLLMTVKHDTTAQEIIDLIGLPTGASAHTIGGGWTRVSLFYEILPHGGFLIVVESSGESLSRVERVLGRYDRGEGTKVTVELELMESTDY